MTCRELFQMGVRCFDIDVVTTADRQLLVAHPRALQVYLETASTQIGIGCWACSIYILHHVCTGHTAYCSRQQHDRCRGGCNPFA